MIKNIYFIIKLTSNFRQLTLKFLLRLTYLVAVRFYIITTVDRGTKRSRIPISSNFIPPSQNRLHSHRVYIQTLIHCATVSLLLPISLLCHFCIKSSYTRTYNTEGKRILPRISRLYSKMDGPHKWIHVIYIFFQ